MEEKKLYRNRKIVIINYSKDSIKFGDGGVVKKSLRQHLTVDMLKAALNGKIVMNEF